MRILGIKQIEANLAVLKDTQAIALSTALSAYLYGYNSGRWEHASVLFAEIGSYTKGSHRKMLQILFKTMPLTASKKDGVYSADITRLDKARARQVKASLMKVLGDDFDFDKGELSDDIFDELQEQFVKDEVIQLVKATSTASPVSLTSLLPAVNSSGNDNMIKKLLQGAIAHDESDDLDIKRVAEIQKAAEIIASNALILKKKADMRKYQIAV